MMPHSPARALHDRPMQPVLLCPSAVTDPELMDGVLSVLSDEQLLSVGHRVDQHQLQRKRSAILAELRTAVAHALDEGETDSAAPVTHVGIRTRTHPGMPPHWSPSNLLLRHADGASTSPFDATHTELEELLPDLTCLDQPASGDVLTVDLRSGAFSR
ncbi:MULTISPECIES: hypothetical protein [Streptomyces]|uniref:Uncharacterized protein n=1 Tax=Streptomyces zinciresistens K42 TaxID=700597 RepID=G2GEY9_9ACTN|nr:MULTISPECIES: hypothetical protein [Streptomyces]EGX57930.1 hypothetical protein SZN_20362 [Streptomyces zinciresistens K42]MDT9700165.1 hypothetical protein [Streptomyces sp. P17]